MSNGAGKGSVYRPVDKKKYDENYDRIFGAKKAEAGIMNELKPMDVQMRDRADELEKALEIKLWCWQCCGQPHLFQIGFDLNVSTYLNFRERDRQHDYAQMKSALMKGVKTLQNKLKEIEEYEHHNKS